MGTWKFLVQRDGKRSWTVLEGEAMSLEPGRYRIAARATVANTPIAIEISVLQASGERRTYRRSTRTNEDGLLAVMPFTELEDGDWMLTCQAVGERMAAEWASMSWRVLQLPTPEMVGAGAIPEIPEEAAPRTAQPEPKPTSESTLALAPEPVAEPESEVKTEVKTEPGTESEPELAPDLEPEPDLAATTDENWEREPIAAEVQTEAQTTDETTAPESEAQAEVTTPEALSAEASAPSEATVAEEAQERQREEASSPPSGDAIASEAEEPQDSAEGAAEPESRDVEKVDKIEVQPIALIPEAWIETEPELEPEHEETKVGLADSDSIAEPQESDVADRWTVPTQIALPDITAVDAEVETEAEAKADVESRATPISELGDRNKDTEKDIEDESVDRASTIANNVIPLPGLEEVSEDSAFIAPPTDIEEEEVVDNAEFEPYASRDVGTAETSDEQDEPIDERESDREAPIPQPQLAPIDRSDSLISLVPLVSTPETLPDTTLPDIASIGPTAPQPVLTRYEPDSLALQLDRTNFSIDPGGMLVLSGCIRTDGSIPPETKLAGLHLRLRLREPQSLQLLLVRQYLLTPESGGTLRFERWEPLPTAIDSTLILGELLLCDTVPETIAKQSFTIVSGLDSLLDNLTAQQQPKPEPSPAVWQQNRWSDADRPTEKPPSTTPTLLPEPSKPHLDLPGFVAGGSSGIDKSQLLASLGLAPETGADEHPADDPLDAIAIGDDLDLNLDPEDELAASRRAATEGDRDLEPLDPPSHRSDRFVSRLNQFARDNELVGWLDPEELDLMEAEPDERDLENGGLAPLTRAGEVLTDESADADREAAREIVLDRLSSDSNRSLFHKTQQTAATRPVLPQETSIPSPDLRVPPGQLTAGRSILVRARLPELKSRIYVKLWIFDRQNQALLDGPRWLTDFLPLGDGTVEGMVNITVPYGGLDVQFEAIAVEVETDRESYKTAVERRIIPVAPPTLPLEKPLEKPLEQRPTRSVVDGRFGG